MRTFAVSDVSSPDRLLRPASLAESLLSRHDISAEASGCNLEHLVTGKGHPFIAAVRAAFANHYPLALSPDDVWLCIAQGFGTHVELHAEELRDRMVRHEGQACIVVVRDEFIRGSQDNDWPGCFAELSDQIATHVGKLRDLAVASFSTTGPVEKAASEIVLMNSLQSYFQYVVVTRCGIPAITLLGTVDDWRSIRRRVEFLAELGLSAWVTALLPVLDQFVTVAAGGEVDRKFWQSFYKRDAQSGGPYVSGWINVLFPYLEVERQNPLNPSRITRMRVQNEFVSTWREAQEAFHSGPNEAEFPRGISRAPFIWDYYGTHIPMTFLGGFVGVSQEPETWTVRPAIGWAVREAAAGDAPGEGDIDDEEYRRRMGAQYAQWRAAREPDE